LAQSLPFSFVAALKIDLYEEQQSLNKDIFFLHVTSKKNRLCSRSNLANDVCLVAKVVETELLSS